jgi:hypothetical protein
MVAIAWYPHTFFHLSFGIQDQLADILNKLDFSVEERVIARAHTQQRLRQAISLQSDKMKLDELLRYVPFRLLTPFFDTGLRSQKDSSKNEAIRDGARQGSCRLSHAANG